MLSVGLATPARADPEPSTRGILIFDDSGPDSQFVRRFRQEIHSTLDSENVTRYLIYSETLGVPRFKDLDYESYREFFDRKYKNIPIDVVVALGTDALKFASRIRADAWPKAPIVFVVVGDASDMPSIVPSNATGVIQTRQFGDMIETARLVVPGLTQIVLVGGPSEGQPLRPHYQEDAQQAAKSLKVIDLTALPFANALARVAALPSDAAIIYITLRRDEFGLVHNPFEAIKALVGAANRPIIVDSDKSIGIGAIGGRVLSPEHLGRGTAMKVARILGGEIASNIPVTVEDSSKLVFDSRQLDRWGVDLAMLPTDSDIRFNQASAWSRYRWQIVAASVVFVIQGLAILWFFHERRRRKIAENDSNQHLLEVTKLDRAMTASAMSTSIAHELSQPLSAILNNAEAAEMLLNSNSLDLSQLKEILADIHRDDQRAVGIIKHLRMLLKQSELRAQDFDMIATVKDTLEILAPMAEEQGVALQSDAASINLRVRADPIHLQQVILNLGTNAIDAMQTVSADKRKLTLRIRQQDGEAIVSVEDTGIGIPQGKLNSIFKAFVTTKAQGTGLGLSIAKTIIETHGGTIWAENRPEGGAAFHFTLKLVQAEVT